MTYARNKNNTYKQKMKNAKLIHIAASVLAATTIICGGCATSQQTEASHSQASSIDSTAAKAKEDADIDAISKALLAYKSDLGSFPTTEKGLNALVQANGAVGWKGPYIQEVPHTPWGDNYHYDIRAFSFFDGTSSSSTHTGYMISVENSSEKFHCVPKNQFESIVGFDAYFIQDPALGVGIKSPSQYWRWWDWRKQNGI